MSIHRHVSDGPESAAAACARKIADLLETALAGHAEATLAVSGGSTPALMFDSLAALPVDWARVHVFWVDERMVPPTDARSNFLLADQRLLARVRLPRTNVHRIHGELAPSTAARQYAEDVRAFFDLAPGALPHFDVVHLGLGADGHTASLFPGEPLIDDRAGLAAAVHAAHLDSWRVTLLPGVLLAARHTLMLAPGADKADALHNVLRGAYEPRLYPAQVVLHHARNVHCFLDRASAARLT